MKHTRQRRHLRPRLTRSQIHHRMRHFEMALGALRVEAAFELKRPSPSPDRIHRLQERADFLLDRIAELERL